MTLAVLIAHFQKTSPLQAVARDVLQRTSSDKFLKLNDAW